MLLFPMPILCHRHPTRRYREFHRRLHRLRELQQNR
jgi:hypothetical protein